MGREKMGGGSFPRASTADRDTRGAEPDSIKDMNGDSNERLAKLMAQVSIDQDTIG